MRFVPNKSIEQQDIQALHRARQRMVNHRTAVVSQIRGLLLDRGIAFPKSITRARRMIPEILTDEENELTALAREAIGELHDLFRDLDLRIASFDKKIERVFRASEDCQRIARIKGVGPKTATAVIAAIGDGTEFKNGRHLAAWVGLVPRQHSQRSAHRPARHLQTRQPAPEIPARAWRPIRRPHGGRKGGSIQHLGQPASPAAWLQPGHGGRRQQERTDHLGRASERRSLPRRWLRAHHEVARR